MRAKLGKTESGALTIADQAEEERNGLLPDDLGKIRSHNDYYFFLLKIFKEELKHLVLHKAEINRAKEVEFDNLVDEIDTQTTAAFHKSKPDLLLTCEELSAMQKKQKELHNSFKRTKEQLREKPNFKDCRPGSKKDN